MYNNHSCLVCLGSNSDAEFHMENAQKALVKLFHEVRMGKLIKTKVEGNIAQPDYLNQAARFTTTLESDKVIALLKEIEKGNGRKPEDKYRGCVPMDIDLLVYDDKVLKPNDLSKHYVNMAIQMLDK